MRPGRTLFLVCLAASIAASGVAQRPASQAVMAQPPNLALALLALSDLPDGWFPTEVSAVEALVQPESGLCGLNPAINGDLAEQEVAAAYQLHEGGPYVLHAVARFRRGQAAAGLAEFRAHLLPALPCRWRDRGADVITAVWEAWALPPPALGDEALALGVTFATSERSALSEVIIIRRGDVVSILGLIAFEGEGVALDPDLIANLARRVDARLAAF